GAPARAPPGVGVVPVPVVPAVPETPETATTGAPAAARAALTAAVAAAVPAWAAVAAVGVRVPAAVPVPAVAPLAPLPDAGLESEVETDGPVLPVLVELESDPAALELHPVAGGAGGLGVVGPAA